MYVDSRRLDTKRAIDTDVCVVGGGAAGITLALQLAGQKFRVCMLESGGFTRDPETEELNSAINVGRPYPVRATRLRYFGGSTNHWGGHCAPIRALNFESRPWIGDAAWPFTRAELDPFYARAHGVLQLGDYDYGLDLVTRKMRLSPLPFDASRVESVVSRYNPLRLGQQYRRAVEEAGNLVTYLYANVTSINRHPESSYVSDVSVATISGRSFKVRARYFVLAAGGIENARLLLLSNRREAAGLGNANDLVGRYFMEHIWYVSGLILAANPAVKLPTYVQVNSIQQQLGVRCHIALPEAVIRREQIPDFRAEILAQRSDAFHDSVRSAHAIRDDLQKFDVSDQLLTHLANIIKDPGPVLRRILVEGPPLLYTLANYVEQVPNRLSRIALSNRRDALGLNRATVDWRLSPRDRLGIVKAHQLIAAEVGRSGFGRMRIEIPEYEDLLLDRATGGAHHMGTTRMHQNPRLGVVDANCQMHGLPNLFVAGSSVFPSCGYANPTLTIVALAIRMADRLKQMMNS
jgi:choline dehydrogenase-like flavoprotein